MSRASFFAALQSALFVLLLAAPVGLTLCGVPSGRLTVEKRSFAPKPETAQLWTDPAAYGPALAAYVRDAAPFRDHLIRAGFRLRLALLQESPMSSVVWGRDGWLFFTQESALDDYLRAIPLDANDIRDMVRIQKERRDWLAARGIVYVVVFAPNKATAYPEYMPAGLTPIGKFSRLDQIVGPLREAGVTVLDLRDPLAQAKAVRRAYLKTDTHWNGWGAFRASAALIGLLRDRLPALSPLSDDEYRVEEVREHGGDLAEMLVMPDLLPEVNLVPRPLGAALAHEGNPGTYADPANHPDRAMVVRETDRADWPRAVFFHDSFTRPMIPYLAERFSRSVFLWSHAFSPEIVLAERPQVVVLEVVERYVYALTLKNPPEVRAGQPE